MMALSKCVLDRVEERKNELKGRMYGLVEIMSRSVFARMEKGTSTYKNLLDQLVELVFDKFTQDLNEAWRDGCAHGRDLELSLNQHISNDEEYSLDSEIDDDSMSISTFESHTLSSEQSLDDDADYDGEEYFSIMARMDGVDQCVLDRMSERKIEFKDRAYGLMEIMSRTVFARMVKRTSVYKNLLDQLVEQVFNKFIQELNEAWRDGCAHGRDEWNVYSDFGDLFEDQPEMNNLDLIEPLSSQPQQSPQSINTSKTSQLQKFKIYEEVDDREYNDDICEEMMNNVQNEEQSEELVRDDQTTRNDSNLSEANGQMDWDMNEDVQHGNDQELALNGQVDDEDSDAELHKLAHVKNQASSRHLVRECRIDDAEEKLDNEMELIESSLKRWTWNKGEKYRELRKNDQIDGDEGNDEVGEECDDDESEVKDMDQDGLIVGNDEEFMDDQVKVDEGNDEDIEDRIDHLNCHKNGSITDSSLHSSPTPSQPSSQSQHENIIQHEEHVLYSEVLIGSDLISSNLSEASLQQSSPLHPNEGQLVQNVRSGQVTVPDKSPPTGKPVCEHCGKVFKKRSNLNVHIRTHTGYRPFVCTWENCGKGFIQRSDLTVHIRTHTGDRPYKYPKCPKAFNQKTHMKEHITSQHDKLQTGKHVCTYCAKSFTYPSKLENHIRTHTGERPYKCPKCAKTFNQKAHMKQHIASQHDKLQTGKHVCTYCDRKFPSPSKLEIHIRTHTGVRPYKCPKCGKGFKASSNLALHLQNQIGELSFKCDHDSCDMLTFATNCSLQRHIILSHVSLLPNVCEQCGKGFVSPSDLIRHIRTHTGEKPHKCPFENCNKAFAQLNTMKLHHKSHTGQLSHACAHCTRRFATPSLLKIHIRIHTGERPFQCTWKDCGMGFISKHSLNRHCITHGSTRVHSIQSVKSENN